MSVQWPTDIPQTPLLNGYTTARMNNRVVSSVDGGLNKQRARYLAVPKQVEEEYILSNAQKLSFETWYANTLEYGGQEFTKENPETGVNSTYRFEGESVPEFDLEGYGKGGPLWRMSLSLEILPG